MKVPLHLGVACHHFAGPAPDQQLYRHQRRMEQLRGTFALEDPAQPHVPKRGQQDADRAQQPQHRVSQTHAIQCASHQALLPSLFPSGKPLFHLHKGLGQVQERPLQVVGEGQVPLPV